MPDKKPWEIAAERTQVETQPKPWETAAIKKKRQDTVSEPSSNPLEIGGNPFQSSPLTGKKTNTIAPSILSPELQQDYIDKNKRLSDALNEHINIYQGSHTKEENEAMRQAENTPIEGKIYKNDNEFWNQTKAGAKKIASSLLHGGIGLIQGAGKVATEILPGGEDFKQGFREANKAADLGLNPEFEGTGAINRAIAGLAEFTPAILGAESSAGATYFLQGVGNADKQVQQMKDQGVDFKNGSDELYTYGSGVVNYFLMKGLPINKLFNKLPKSLRDDVVGKASLDMLKSLGDKKLTSEGIAQAAKDVSLKLQDRIKSGGIKFLEHYAKTAKDLTGLQLGDYVLKAASNSLSGKENFEGNPEQLAEGIKRVFTEDAPAFSILGAGIEGIRDKGALFRQSRYRNQVVDAFRKDASDANAEQVKQDIATHGEEQGWSPQEIDNSIQAADVIHQAAKAIPKEFGDAKFNKAIDLITGRKELEDQLSEIKASKAGVDASVADIPTKEESLIEAKLDQSNDKLRELATDHKYRYEFDEEKGTYSKKLGENGKSEEISKDRYQLEQLEKEFRKPTKVSDEVSAPIIQKANDDIEVLKKVQDKTKKYEASIKRITEAKNDGKLTENDFNEIKSRFDDVMKDSEQTIKNIENESTSKENDNENLGKEPNGQEDGQILQTEREVEEGTGDGQKGDEGLQQEKVNEEPIASNVVANELQPEATTESPAVNSKETSKVDEVVPEFANEGEAIRYEVENATDPEKLASLYHNQTSEPHYIEKGIIDYLGNSKINLKDYERWGDRNNLDGNLKRRWVDSDNKSMPLDTQAQELSNQLGVEVTPEDIVETVTRYKNRKDFEANSKSKEQLMIEEKYRELTGKNLTPKIAEKAANKIKLTPKTDEELYEINEGLKEIGITYEDIKRYADYSNQGDGVSEESVQSTKNEQSGRKTEDRSDKGSEKQVTTESKTGDTLRKLADKLEAGKINKLGGFRASTGFDAVWDGSLTVVAESLRTGAKIVDAIEAGLKHIRESDWYKDLKDKKDFEDKYRSHMEGELAETTETTKKEVKSGESLTELSSYVPKGGEVKKYLSGETIEKYEGDELRNDQSYIKQELQPALEHGIKIIDAAKKEFGDDYVNKTLDFIENHGAGVESKALMYVSLENDLAARKLAEPENELKISKLQDLVRSKSQAYLRANAIEINMGRLRKIGEVGYDLSQVTNGFFSSKESAGRSKVEKSIQSDADEINKADEALQSEDVESAIDEGVEKRINEIYESMPSARRKKADKAIEALTRIQKRLRSNIYESTIAVPVAIIDAGISTIKAAIRAGVNVADAVELGIKKIKEKYGKDWKNEDRFRKDMLGGFEKEGIETKSSPKDRLESAKENAKERIEELKTQIENKRRELKARDVVKPDAELTSLLEEEKTLKEIANQYLTKESIDRVNESKEKSIVTRLTNEISDIDKQIEAGEKAEREAKKDPYQSPEINKLKAQKEARLKILEEIDPEVTDLVKNSLIDGGFGREITVKTKDGKVKKQVLDWKKLAGEEGSIDKIRENVENALKGKGYSDGDISRMKASLEKEYNAIRASVIEKSLAELESRNTAKEAPDRKSSAKRLAELYNYGLFEKESDSYDYIMNKSLGLSDLGQKSFFEAKRLAKSLAELYSTKSNGRTISEFGLKHTVRNINGEIERLLSKVAWEQSNGAFKAATIVKEYMGLAQRNMLQSVKQFLENPISGFTQRAFTKLGFSFDKIDTKELAKSRQQLENDILKDVVFNGGLAYGDVSTPFISKTRTEDWLNRKSDSQLYHAVVSGILGRAYLEGADSMHKATITEKYFEYNLIKVLTDAKNPNRMSKEDAVKYVSENLTGQSFKDAQSTAKEIIDKVNKSAGKVIVPDNEQSINRLANNIVKDALVAGHKLTAEEIESSYKAAYRAAGFDIGHEANNPISEMVGNTTSGIENKIKQAIKEKKWNEAAAYTFGSILSKNILNPFVGGGTNWVVLTLQKAGLDPVSPLYDYARKSSNHLDITTPDGIKNMEKSLALNLKSKNTNTRVLVGAMASLLVYAAAKGTNANENIDKWLKKNAWAKKYFNTFSPTVLTLMLAAKNKELGRYFASLLNLKTDSFDNSKKMVQGVEGITSGKRKEEEKGKGKVGEAIGSYLGVPIVPWRMVRDVDAIQAGLRHKSPKKVDFNSSGFWNGYFKAGLLDYMGLRPSTKTTNKTSVNEK